MARPLCLALIGIVWTTTGAAQQHYSPPEVDCRRLNLAETLEVMRSCVSADSASVPVVPQRSRRSPFAVEVSGSGPPIILIPGLSCGGDVWKETVDHFRDRYECHVLTLAGFAGEPPIEPPLLPKYRDGVIAYIVEEKLQQPILIGHSLGGLLAYWIAATAPESVGPVIAVDGVPFYSAVRDPDATPATAEDAAIRRRSLIQNAGPLRSAIQNRMYVQGLITDGEDLQRVVAIANRSDPETVGQAMYELLTTDLREDLTRIQSPVLLIGATGSSPDDEHRQTKETRYRRQTAAIPRHDVIFHSTSRHFVQFDAPQWLWKQIERFLAQHDADRATDPESHPDVPPAPL